MQELTFEQVEVVSGGFATTLSSPLGGQTGPFVANNFNLTDKNEDVFTLGSGDITCFPCSIDLFTASPTNALKKASNAVQNWANSWQEQNCGDKDIHECAEEARKNDSSGML